MNRRNILDLFQIRNPLSLNIHCWGGLGSQLFAIAIAYELSYLNLNREIRLVLHSSGVTLRESEISHLNLPFNVESLRDFSTKTKDSKAPSYQSQRNLFKVSLVRLLEFLRIIVFSGELSKVMPWTVQLRGHYTDRVISQRVLVEIYSLFESSGFPVDSKHEENAITAMHYRLGDLVFLSNKSFIDPSRIAGALDFIHGDCEDRRKEVTVYSDTIETAESKLRSINSSFVFTFKSKSSWETIHDLVRFDNFIATNSKIGIWVVLLRSLGESKGMSLVPKELQIALELEIENKNFLTKIHYY